MDCPCPPASRYARWLLLDEAVDEYVAQFLPCRFGSVLNAGYAHKDNQTVFVPIPPTSRLRRANARLSYKIIL